MTKKPQPKLTKAELARVKRIKESKGPVRANLPILEGLLNQMLNPKGAKK